MRDLGRERVGSSRDAGRRTRRIRTSAELIVDALWAAAREQPLL